MAASHDECVAQFPRQQCCIDRLYSRLLSWAAYVTAQALPPTDTAPDPAWVRQRVLAEQLPAQATTYVNYVSPYLVGVPQISDRVREHLNAWNDDATETSLGSDIDGGLAVIMPKVADVYISDSQVAAWCDKHGYPPPDLGTAGAMIAPMMPPPMMGRLQ